MSDDDFKYEQVTDDMKRQMLVGRISQLEQQHYNVVVNQVLAGDANDPAKQAEFTVTLAQIEQAVAKLRELVGALPPATPDLLGGRQRPVPPMRPGQGI